MLTAKLAKSLGIPCLLTSEALDVIGPPYEGWSDLREDLTMEEIKEAAKTKVRTHSRLRPYTWKPNLPPATCRKVHLDRVAWLMQNQNKILGLGPVELVYEDFDDGVGWGDGHHRSSAMIALDWEVIPVRLSLESPLPATLSLSKYFPQSYKANTFRVGALPRA